MLPTGIFLHVFVLVTTLSSLIQDLEISVISEYLCMFFHHRLKRSMILIGLNRSAVCSFWQSSGEHIKQKGVVRWLEDTISKTSKILLYLFYNTGGKIK